MDDPKRWSERNGAPPGMEKLLRVARNTRPTISETDSVGARLGVPRVGPGLSTARLITALGLAGVIAGAGFGGRLVSGSHSRALAIDGSRWGELSGALARSAGDLAQRSVPGVPHWNEKSAETAVVGRRVLPSESELLVKARASLSSDPKLALTWVAEHRKYYPRGVLAQEREVIAVRALKATGELQAAEEKASSFVETFPDSAHRRRVTAD